MALLQYVMKQGNYFVATAMQGSINEQQAATTYEAWNEFASAGQNNTEIIAASVRGTHAVASSSE